jgi:uncharacterized membrane protein YdjX (TVP38/TMEM64 family)
MPSSVQAALPSATQPAPRSATPAHSVSAAELVRRLGPAGPLALIAATLPALGGFLLLAQLGPVGAWLRSHEGVGLWIYLVIFALTSGLALLPTYSQAALGGWTFGFAAGFPAALGGLIGGSLIGYGLARPAAGRRVITLIEEHPRWRAVYDALLGGGRLRTLLIVTLLRLPPNSPFAMTNLVLAATRVPFPLYAFGTALGMAPRTGMVVYLASRAPEFDPARGQDWLYWSISIVVTLAVLAAIGAMANRALSRMTGATAAARGSSDR